MFHPLGAACVVPGLLLEFTALAKCSKMHTLMICRLSWTLAVFKKKLKKLKKVEQVDWLEAIGCYFLLGLGRVWQYRDIFSESYR